MEGLIQALHGITDKAVAVGFGVSGPDQVLSPSFSILISAMLSLNYPDAHYLVHHDVGESLQIVVRPKAVLCRRDRSWPGVQRESLWEVLW